MKKGMPQIFRTHCKTARGFTLVELMVVISIVAMLIALLLPALGRSKEMSARVVCAANLRQIGAASIVLSKDNKGWINGINEPNAPPNVYFPSGSPYPTDISRYWPVMLNNYLQAPPDTAYNNFNTLVRRGAGCPNAPYTNPTADTNIQWIGYGSFGGNSQLIGGGYIPIHPLHKVVHTERVSLATECAEIWTYSTPYYLDNTNYGYAANGLAPRHRADGLNVVYVDGHAGFLRAPAPPQPYPAFYSPVYGHWWDSTPGANNWYPTAWDFGFLKE